MPSLRELQLGFARAVFGSAAAHDTPQLRAGTLPAEDRLGIYRTSVFLNYTRALGATYAAVQALIGPGCFSQLAAAFVRAAPSRSGDLNRYGAGFAGFLQTAPVVADLPYLPDVARLEWCMDEAFH